VSLPAREFDEIPEMQVDALLRKLAWALRQDPVADSASHPGKVRFFRIDRRFIEVASDLVRVAAHKSPESYRRAVEDES